MYVCVCVCVCLCVITLTLAILLSEPGMMTGMSLVGYLYFCLEVNGFLQVEALWYMDVNDASVVNQA